MATPSDPSQPPPLYCPRCGYDLTGLTRNQCPECGQEFDPLLLRSNQPLEPVSFRVTRSNSFKLVREAYGMDRSMVCPACGAADRRFMPRTCAKCGSRFTLWQRVFGARPPRPGRQ